MTPTFARAVVPIHVTVLVLVALVPACTDASAGDESARTKPSREDGVRAILTESLGDGHAYSLLRELCTQAPSRLSGSAGAMRAVALMKERMEAAGLENVRLEPCRVPVWRRGAKADLRVIGADDVKLEIAALGGSIATPEGGIEGELVEVQSFDELRALGERARGKVVLFNRPMDRTRLDPFAAYGGAVDQRSRGAIEAAKAGASAAIVRSMTLSIDDLPHTGAMRYENGVTKVPAAAISTAGAEKLAARLRGTGSVRVRLLLDCSTLEDADSFNVIGEVRGASRPDEIVLLGAHLDAWELGQGAHDDGAGCAQVVEALRLVKKLGLRPRRTLRAVLYMNEENGLRGAVAYRDTHADELARHVLALETDRGGFAPQGFGTDAGPAAFAMLGDYTTLFKGTGADRLVPGDGGADISVLAKSGVVLMEYLPDPQRYFDVHHCARDVIAQVHPRELELGAGLIAAIGWCAADDERVLPRNEPKKN